jgi:YHS domain-containing protein
MMCDNCGQNAIRYKAHGATGWKYFCSEKCWADFNAMPIQEEGHYRLERLE